jgi:hypothetical protein
VFEHAAGFDGELPELVLELVAFGVPYSVAAPRLYRRYRANLEKLRGEVVKDLDDQFDDLREHAPIEAYEYDGPPWSDYDKEAREHTRPLFRRAGEFRSPEYVLQGVYERGLMYAIIGPPKQGKSSVVLDQACHIATGRTWTGRGVGIRPLRRRLRRIPSPRVVVDLARAPLFVSRGAVTSLYNGVACA